MLETIDELIKKKYSIIIKTSSKSLFSIIKKQKNLKYDSLEVIFVKRKTNFEFFYLLKAIFFYSFIFFYIKIFIEKKNLLVKSKNILVECFILNEFKNKENFNKNITKIKNKNIFLVPSFLIQKNLLTTIKTINKVNLSKYIFKEHYLSLYDYFYSILHFMRKKKFLSNYQKFKHWDLNSLINFEISSNKNIYSAIIGILNYRFFKRLNEKNILLKKTICLFENQAVGRGWSLGSRTFFPNVENLGYQGYINFSQFLNSTPCEFEEKAKVIPNKIAVINKVFKKNKREFFSKVKVITAPALNYQFNSKKLKKKEFNKFTLVLTGIKNVDLKLINWSLRFLRDNKKTKLTIKFHPILPLKSFKISLFKSSRDQIDFSNEDINSILSKSLLIVSTGPTTAIYEAFLKECFLLIPVFDPWDKLNLENCKIPKENYNLANNFQEFSFNLKNMIKNKTKTKLKKVEKYFSFEKINKQNVKIFE